MAYNKVNKGEGLGQRITAHPSLPYFLTSYSNNHNPNLDFYWKYVSFQDKTNTNLF